MKLLEQVALVARRGGLSGRTVAAYTGWIRQYLAFSARARGGWTHPVDLGTADVEAFLNDLVGRRDLSASAQNQALCALVFLYGRVLEDVIPQNHLGKFALLRSRRPKRLPTVLSAGEVAAVIAAVPDRGKSRLMAELLYGTGMRVGECCTLRVRDVDLGRAQINVRAGTLVRQRGRYRRKAPAARRVPLPQAPHRLDLPGQALVQAGREHDDPVLVPLAPRIDADSEIGSASPTSSSRSECRRCCRRTCHPPIPARHPPCRRAG